MKKFFLVFFLAANCQLPTADCFSQISEGGIPVSFRYENVLQKNIPVKLMQPFNLDSIRKEDEINDKRKDIPWRFGFNFPVNFSLNNSGIWENLDNGSRIWRLKISSKNALSINLIFGEYIIPDGGKVFIYNEAKTHILGAFTEKNNLPHKKLGVDLIYSDAVIVEYFEPHHSIGKGILMIEQVTHGYRNSQELSKDFGDSGPCNNNVVCPDGAPWQEQIRATAMNLVNGNSWCSGALINNTCQDGTPYYLTANHCVVGSVANWVFRFNYESPTCSPSTDGPYNFTVSGATLLAKNSATDFALLELSSPPPISYNVFYAGWDRSGNNPQKQVGIHHPNGDVKKISFDYEPAIDTVMFGIKVWQISSWNDGTTESGSSGSPLFDENKRIIGQLYGGSASCTSLTDDNYGKFNVSWDFGGTPTTQLKDWLDMCNTQQVFIDGYDPNTSTLNYDAETYSIGGISPLYCGNNLDSVSTFCIIKNKGTETLTKLTVLFGLNGNMDSLIWNGSLATNQYDSVFFPLFMPPAGDHFFSVTVKNPNDSLDQKNINDSKSFSFKYISDPQFVVFTLKTDDYGSETSWQVKDSSGNLWYSGGNYNDVSGGQTITDSMCFAKGCYTFIINDDYGDGMSGFNGAGTQGTYFFQNETGDTIANIINVNFGYQEINNFCLDNKIHFEVASQINCFGNCNGALQVLPNFGNPPYSYQWSANTGNQTTQTATGLCAGIFSVTVTDSAGYFFSEAFNLIQPDSLSITIYSVNTAADTCTGSASIVVSGGTAPYNYLWSTTEAPNPDSLCAGTYYLTVTDSMNCTKTDSIVISILDNIREEFSEPEIFIFPNPNDGRFNVRMGEWENVKIEIKIYNVLGEVVFSKQLTTNNKQLTTNLQSGIYFYQIITPLKIHTGKIIVE